MLTRNLARPQDPAAITELFNAVADAMRQAVTTTDSSTGQEPQFELCLTGPRLSIPEDEQSGPDTCHAEPVIAAAARDLDSALRLLRRRAGVFTCRTRGEISGALLELALMADRHLMHADAVLIPSGLFDFYVPHVFGWSLLIERVGAARAFTLLLTQARVDARQALMSGLCDAVEREETENAPGAGAPARVPASATALHLALELSDRTTRTGGLTPRQSRLLERAAFALAFSTGDPREGIASFFADRPARFAPENADHPASASDPAKA